MVATAALVTAFRPELGPVLGHPSMLVGYLAAGVLFLRGARRYDGRERLSWQLIGLALFIGAAGVLAVGVVAVLGYDVPAFGPLDIIFITAYLVNLAGLWALPHLGGLRVRRLRIIIDGLVGAISMGVVAWVWFLSDILERFRSAEPWQVIIGSAYPLIDVLTLVAVMVVTLRRSSLRFDPRVLVFGFGLAAQAVADLIYLHRGIGQSFEDAAPVYPLFILAAVAFLIVGMLLEHRPPPREYAERRTPWWAMVAPYGAALALIATFGWRFAAEQYDFQTIELFVGSIIVVVLIIFRQALAIRETRELVEHQRTALVSSISHELRTPLTAMVGFLEILSDPDQQMDPDARQELIGIVEQQANYMARIVADLVMLNRADPDLGLEETEVDVKELVQSAVTSLDLDSGPGVGLDLEPDIVGVFDPNRIRQVLVNLLTNAARYGGPERLVVARRRQDDLILEVHDNGPGVPKRYELSIWDRFERGAHRYNAGIPGSGIGLALVAMLVSAHGGTVGYRRSERLGGACFYVVLHGRARTAEVDRPSLERVGREDP